MRGLTYRTALIAMVLGATTVCAAGRNPAAEILWDAYGVPHIYAHDNASLFRAFGYAQMQSHGDLILKLYGQARGRAAEYWGERYLASDRWAWTNRIPERAQEWYRRQSAEYRRYLDAFAEGMNEYGRTHADKLAPDVRIVLPVSGADVLAHGERQILFTFVTSLDRVRAEAQQARAQSAAGSNAWAIAPKRTAAGHAMLLANPHLPWSDIYLFYEAQLNAPGVNIYGTTLVGTPQIAIGFNDQLGWSHTVNTIDAQDVYELTPAGNGYRYDGAIKPFAISHHMLKVKQSDGSSKEEDLTIRESVHGPVVLEMNGKLYALRVAGLDSPGAGEEWWDMDRAHNLQEFEAALKKLQIPMFNVIYADRDGHILYLFNGTVPVRPRGDWNYWSRAVPGDSSATLWTKIHAYSDLPRVVDPPSGWVQNANDPPWTCTYPAALDRDQFPPYMAPPGMSFRAQRSTRMLRDEAAFTVDKLVAAKHSTHSELADRMLDELINAARKSDNEEAKNAAEVLSQWDRSAEAGSRGALLFVDFASRWLLAPGAQPFEKPWSPADPLGTPRQIADTSKAITLLAQAGEAAASRYGSMDAAWGDVNRFSRDNVDLPGNGGPGQIGIFRVIDYSPRLAAHTKASGGDSFVAAVEFSNPVRAKVVIAYGNSSQPGSRHATDQLEFAAKKQMRTAWLTRSDVESHLESRDVLQ